MHGVFTANGRHFVVGAPMTDLEASAYTKSPETFFGVFQNVGRRANNSFELAKFMYEHHRKLPKERLLEFLKDHPNLEKLKSYSQRDLAIFIAEQGAVGAAVQDRRAG